MEIAKLPDDKIEEAIKEVADKKLTVKQTKALVQKTEKKRDRQLS